MPKNRLKIDEFRTHQNYVKIEKVSRYHNIVNPLTKPLPQKKYDSYLLDYGMRYKGNWLKCEREVVSEVL